MFQTAFSLTRRSGIVHAINEPRSPTKAIHSVPLTVNLDEAKDIPLCINCKYFSPYKNSKEAEYAECKKHGEVSVIDGTIKYRLVTVARQYFCRGNDFEPSELKEYDPESHKEFFR